METTSRWSRRACFRAMRSIRLSRARSRRGRLKRSARGARNGRNVSSTRKRSQRCWRTQDEPPRCPTDGPSYGCRVRDTIPRQSQMNLAVKPNERQEACLYIGNAKLALQRG